MDGMARPCGVDVPDAEGSQPAHAAHSTECRVERQTTQLGLPRVRDERAVREVKSLISQTHRVLPVSLFSPFAPVPLFS